MRKLFFLLLILSFTLLLKAQPVKCTFEKPLITINFGSGRVPDLNTEDPSDYRRVMSYCPTDGHYTYTPFTSDCFRSDWLTLAEDHTPGDAAGNMMIVNASPSSGAFLKTTIIGLKKGAIYEFSVWMMNVCKPTEKCPFPLLPNITILLQTPTGKIVAQLGLGELVRREAPEWTRFQALFNAPPGETTLTLTMIDNAPGGCGNDFALDDISFRECIKTIPIVTTKPKAPAVAKPKPAAPKTPVAIKPKPEPPKAPVTVKPKPEPPKIPVAVKPKPVTPKAPVVVKTSPSAPKQTPKTETPSTEKRQLQISEIRKPQIDSSEPAVPPVRQKPMAFPPPPPLLTGRTNSLIKKIETEPGEIKLDLYDNGQIDGDTVSVYHNNVLVVSHARLSEKPITLRIAVDAEHPHHELIMVAHNLGSIPPNTSLMVVNTGTKRYEVFISSNEQKNAKVILDLKE